MSAPMKEHRTADRAQEKRCALRATCRRRLHAVHATAQRRAGASWERSAQQATGSAAAAHLGDVSQQRPLCLQPPPRLELGLRSATASLWCGPKSLTWPALSSGSVRESNIVAAKAVADAVRTSLGPRGMDKMVTPARLPYVGTGGKGLGAGVPRETPLRRPLVEPLTHAAALLPCCADLLAQG